jgi:hypothetical protein
MLVKNILLSLDALQHILCSLRLSTDTKERNLIMKLIVSLLSHSRPRREASFGIGCFFASEQRESNVGRRLPVASSFVLAN